jgi:protoporphyrinogen oxidase
MVVAVQGRGVQTTILRDCHSRRKSCRLLGPGATWAGVRTASFGSRYFPLYGGIGETFRRMANEFPGKVQRGKELVEVDPARRSVFFADGTGDTYDVVVSTAPLDLVVQRMKGVDGMLLDASQDLHYNNLLVVDLGLSKKIETGRCWIYFADKEIPCHRATYFSHYSPNNVPNGDTESYSSLMCEISFRIGENPDPERILDQIIAGLIRAKILEESDRERIISRVMSSATVR